MQPALCARQCIKDDLFVTVIAGRELKQARGLLAWMLPIFKFYCVFPQADVGSRIIYALPIECYAKLVDAVRFFNFGAQMRKQENCFGRF
ncbi:hypothetical protein BJF95_07095 [Rhizobium oryziradicis]|uniref:Uncharacterized protein n=1 Tax=Rhizobium oryziradicis TaxID=1867956 RepID=A0A1Q8ZQH6_9HYPH|nr:hypothetical protein BJF95_07095 [Rhizobium oryziradicis]